MSPNSQYKIESSEISIIQPSVTIGKITPLKGDDSTTTTATMDDNQQPVATMTPIMSGTMPPEGEIIESPPQTPTEDTTTEAPDENPSPGFDEFLSILQETTPASPNNVTSIKEDEQSGDDNVETSPEEKGGEVEKAETNETSNNDNNNSDKKEGNPSRRRSSELRNEMGTLLNSVNTVVSTKSVLFLSMLGGVFILFHVGGRAIKYVLLV